MKKNHLLIVLATVAVVLIAGLVVVMRVKGDSGRKAEITLRVADGYEYYPAFDDVIVNVIGGRAAIVGAEATSVVSNGDGSFNVTLEGIKDLRRFCDLLVPKGELTFQEGLDANQSELLQAAIDRIDEAMADAYGVGPIERLNYDVETPSLLNGGSPTVAPSRIGSQVGLFAVADTAVVYKLLTDSVARCYLPANIDLVWSYKPDSLENGQFVALNGVGRRVLLDGSYIVDAEACTDDRIGNYIDIRMNMEGSRMWERITYDNIGRPIAILLDGKLICAPNVNNVISGGRSRIDGNFSSDETKEIANLLISANNVVPMRVTSAHYVDR